MIRNLLAALILTLGCLTQTYAARSCKLLIEPPKPSVIKEPEFETNITLKSLNTESGSKKIEVTQNKSEFTINISENEPVTFFTPINIYKAIAQDWRMNPNYTNRTIRPSHLDPQIKTIDENLELSRFDYSKSYYLGSLMMPYRTSFIKPQNAFGLSGLHFLAEGQGQFESAKIIIQTDLTKKLSEQLQKPIYYELDFKVPQQIDWVSARFSEFSLNDSTLATQYSLTETPQEILQLGYQFKKALQQRGKVQFKIHNSIGLNLEVRNDEINSFIDNLFIDHSSRFFFEVFGPRPPDIEIKSVLKKFFTEMQKSQNQDFAKDVVKNGHSSIQQFLAVYGWTAQTMFSKKVTMLDIIECLHRRDLFYEGGGFGDIHGSFAHHTQIIAGLKGLTHSEAKLALDFISTYIGDVGRASQWSIWNALFDSRGYGVTGNRYWRDLLK